MQNKRKGDLLEDLVALLHEAQGVLVEKRKKLPVQNSHVPRTREMDVLITTPTTVGYPVRIAIQCKNEQQALDLGAVDSFFAALNDVGIPPQLGILVSVNGFTRDAQASADAKGIRTLVFEGLTSNRLGQELDAARHSVLFLVASERNINRFEYVPVAARKLPTARLNSDNAPDWPTIMTGLWGMWAEGKIPSVIGDHTVLLAPATSKATWQVIAELTVTGHFISMPGTFTRIALKNTSTEALERLRVEATFDEIPTSAPLKPVRSEQEFQALQQKRKVTLETRVRVPRLASKFGFWPPTMASAQKAHELLKAGKPVTFEGIEGTDILAAWRF